MPKRLVLAVLFSLCAVVSAAEQPTADLIVLKDGRELVGSYDKATEVVQLISKTSGRKMGSMAVKQAEIAEIKSGAVKLPGAKTDTAGAKTATADQIVLKDGRKLIGHYDKAKGVVTLISKSSGRKMGVMNVKADDIEEIKTGFVNITLPGSGKPSGKSSGTFAKGLDGTWTTNFLGAKQMAREHNKLILINFTGSDWCGWCVKLHKEVFRTDEFKEWAKGRVVLLEADFPNRKKQSDSLKEQNKILQDRYKVKSYPTILVINVKGRVLRKWGYARGGFKKWVDGMTRGEYGLESLQRETTKKK